VKMYIPGYNLRMSGEQMAVQESDYQRLENLLDGKIISSKEKHTTAFSSMKRA